MAIFEFSVFNSIQLFDEKKILILLQNIAFVPLNSDQLEFLRYL